MRICKLLCVCVTAVLSGALPAAVSAQTFESIGVRAQGLGGAFVAVADDATATWWNPAGLATAAYVSSVLEQGQMTEPKSPLAVGPGLHTAARGLSVAYPALGVSYYHLRISEIAAPASTVGTAADRQDPASAGSRVRSASGPATAGPADLVRG